MSAVQSRRLSPHGRGVSTDMNHNDERLRDLDATAGRINELYFAALLRRYGHTAAADAADKRDRR